MTNVNVYLTFDGNCEEAFNYYKSVFGGEFTHVSRFGDMPEENCEEPMPDEIKNQIMHVSLPMGDTVLMGSDRGGNQGPPFVAGNNYTLSIDPETKEEADQLFAKLAEGGMIVMPMADTFWNAYFGMCVDKFGINWMINVTLEQ